MRCVYTFNVEGGVSFGVAKALRFLEHGRKVQSLVAHLRQNKVGRAIDDACHPLDAVRRQTFAQGFDDRDAACNSGFKEHHHTLTIACFGSSAKNFISVNCQQSLIGRDHVFACGDGF